MNFNFGDPRLPDRFWNKCIPEPNSGCWLWTGSGSGIGGEYGRTTTTDRKVSIGVHRVSYEAFVGPIPDGMVIDHRCQTKRCCNPRHLRIATHPQNHQYENVRRSNTSGFKGVHYNASAGQSRRWEARIRVSGHRRLYLGVFGTAAEAAVAYDAAAREHHGEFAILNFPNHKES